MCFYLLYRIPYDIVFIQCRDIYCRVPVGLMGLLGVLESLFCPVNCGSYWGFVCGLFGFLENMYGIFLRNFLKKNPILAGFMWYRGLTLYMTYLLRFQHEKSGDEKRCGIRTDNPWKIGFSGTVEFCKLFVSFFVTTRH